MVISPGNGHCLMDPVGPPGFASACSRRRCRYNSAQRRSRTLVKRIVLCQQRQQAYQPVVDIKVGVFAGDGANLVSRCETPQSTVGSGGGVKIVWRPLMRLMGRRPSGAAPSSRVWTAACHR